MHLSLLEKSTTFYIASYKADGTLISRLQPGPADKVANGDIKAAVPAVEVLNITYNTNPVMTMNKYVFDLSFKITDKNAPVKVSEIQIVMPFYLYQGFLSTLKQTDMKVYLTSDNSQAKTISGFAIKDNVIEISL